MRWIEVPFGSDHQRKQPTAALVAECPDCGRREWWLFRMVGAIQLFVQCLYCDRIETADGTPVKTAVAYAMQEAADQAVIHPLSVPGKEVIQ